MRMSPKSTIPARLRRRASTQRSKRHRIASSELDRRISGVPPDAMRAVDCAQLIRSQYPIFDNFVCKHCQVDGTSHVKPLNSSIKPATKIGFSFQGREAA
jgi:hypothetical protein